MVNLLPHENRYRLHSASGVIYFYYPLQQSLLVVNPRAADLIESACDDTLSKECLEYDAAVEFISRGEQKPKTGDSLSINSSCIESNYLGCNATLLLTTACNLKCGYCYSSGGKSSKSMTREMAKAVIDMLSRNAMIRRIRGKSAIVGLGFLGDGEPTCNWDVYRYSMEYLKSRSKNQGFQTQISTISNCLLSTDKAHWIAENIDHISASFDGIREIQNLHRPMAGGGESFDTVLAALRIINEGPVSFSIRMTVTDESVEKLPECVQFVLQELPNITTIHIEPMFLSMVGRGSLSSPNPAIFAEKMTEARAVARKHKKNIYCSMTDFNIRSTHCGGCSVTTLFVTPDGFLSSCTEVTTQDDPRWSHFCVGKWNANTGQLEIDPKQVQMITTRSRGHLSNPECENCFMRWHCGGGCEAKNRHHATLCQLSKKLASDLLSEYVDGAATCAKDEKFTEMDWESAKNLNRPVILRAIGISKRRVTDLNK